MIDVNAHIPAGQQVAVVGETGSGKTTLGRLIARFADPTVGTVRLGGVPLTAVANDELRTRLVVVPQEPFLFDGTIAANLGFARPMLSVPDLEQAIVDPSTSATGWRRLPDGLFTEVGQRGAQLSAGERQLVALVRASLVDPDVLVLDEATSSVDALTEVRIGRALDKLAAGRTIDRDRPSPVDRGPRRSGVGARPRTPGRGWTARRTAGRPVARIRGCSRRGSRRRRRRKQRNESALIVERQRAEHVGHLARDRAAGDRPPRPTRAPSRSAATSLTSTVLSTRVAVVVGELDCNSVVVVAIVEIANGAVQCCPPVGDRARLVDDQLDEGPAR